MIGKPVSLMTLSSNTAMQRAEWQSLQQRHVPADQANIIKYAQEKRNQQNRLSKAVFPRVAAPVHHGGRQDT
ncbi:MAG: hypothetical protein ACRYHA_03995 [Janthinobacterium lividum]